MGPSLKCDCGGDRRMLWPHPRSYSLSMLAKDLTFRGLAEKAREKVWKGGEGACVVSRGQGWLGLMCTRSTHWEASLREMQG